MSKQHVIQFSFAFVIVLVFGAITYATSTIGWNFVSNWPMPTIQGDGFSDGFDQWTDSIDEANSPGGTVVPNSTDAWAVTTPINAPGVSVAWSSANMWAAGNEDNLDQALYRVYLDDGGAGASVTVSGLAAWLADSGDPAYQIRFYRSSDRDGWGFSVVNIYEGTDDTGTLLETVAQIDPGTARWDNDGPTGALDTNWAPRDYQDTAGSFTADTITFRLPKDGTNLIAGSLAGFKITTIPEPATGMLCGIAFVFLGAWIVRKRHG